MGIEKEKTFARNRLTAAILLGIILFSVGTLNIGIPPQIAEAATADSCDNNLTVKSVTASKSSTSPYRAIDGLFETSWNAQGKNSWIKLDLGKIQTICYADIDWFAGASRQYNFEIFASGDGSTWVLAYTGKSSGSQTAFDHYEFDDVDARWMRIVVSGNQNDMRASIQEVEAHGHEVGIVTEPPAPEPVSTSDTRYDPDTVIDSVTNGLGQQVSNGGTTSSSTLSIAYHGTDNVSVEYFEGSLNGASWSKLTSNPVSMTVNTEGQQTYLIRAIDGGNRVDQTPAQFTWTYDKEEPIPIPSPDVTPPSVTIQSPKNGESFPAGTTSITMNGTASDDIALSVVEVSLVGGSKMPVTGSESWTSVAGSLSDGQSYTVEVKASDAAGNIQTVQTSFSIQSPAVPPAPDITNEKMLKVTLNTWSDEEMQYYLFNPYLDSDTDQVRLHVSLNHAITAEEYSLTESLPGRTKGMEFFTLAEIRAHASILKQKGYDFCDYDIEPGEGHTPQAEFDDFVNSIKTASMICHNAGIEMHCSPANWKLRQSDNIEKVAPHCDELHFQFQVAQEDPARFLSYTKEYSARAKAANPDIKLTVQLSTQQPAAPGMSLVDTFKTDWINVKQYVDGVSIWWGNNSVEKTAMTDFMAWFNQQGRA